MGGGRARRIRSRDRLDGGFSLLEAVLSVVVLGLVLTSVATVYVGATAQRVALHDRQTGASLVRQALEVARAAALVPDASGCVGLLEGRTPTAVGAQWASAPAGVDLTGLDPATSTDCAGPASVPLRGLPVGTGPAVLDPVPVGGRSFSVHTYVGRCRLPLAGGGCVRSAVAGSTPSTTVYRVVAAVTWAASRGCAGGCLATSSTLLDASTDPLYNIRHPAPTVPIGLRATAADGSVSLGWSPPASTGDSPLLGYSVTATPADGGTPLTRTVTPTTTTFTGLTNGVSHTFAVSAYSAAGSSAAVTTAAVPYPAGVLSGAALALWLDAADAGTLFTDRAGTTALGAAGRPVALWKDKSARGNDATVPTGAGTPTAVDSYGRLQPGFDGSACLSLGAAGLPHGTDPSTTFVVVELDTPGPALSASGTVVAWGGWAGDDARRLLKQPGSWLVTADSGGARSVGDFLDWERVQPEVVMAEHTPTAIRVAAAGRAGPSQSGPAAGTAASYAGVGCRLGAGEVVQDGWSGRVSEVLVLSRTLSDAEQRAVVEYLGHKWQASVVPSRPQAVTVTAAGSGSLAVTWQPPDWDGGTPVKQYRAAVGGTGSCTSTASGCVVSGLTPGGSYPVTVTAENDKGTGPPSASVSGTAG